MESLSELAFSITHLIAYASYRTTLLGEEGGEGGQTKSKEDGSGWIVCVWTIRDGEQ